MAFEKDDDIQNAAKAFGAIIVLFVVGYLAAGSISSVVASKIPDEWETKWFAGMKLPAEFGTLEKENPKKVEEIFAQLIKVNGLRNLNYRLKVSSMSAPNAFALPGGDVYVTQGLLELVKSDMGIAMVLGHELGHHYHRHVLRRLGRGVIIGIGSTILFGGDPGVLFGLASGLAENSYGHDQEFEADEYGLHLVYQVFKTTDGALEFFEKMESQDLGSSHMLSLLSSHPYSRDRKERLQKLDASLKN